jgi:creatinine amidohydrolase
MAALRVAAESVLERFHDVKLIVLSDYDIIYKYQGDEFPDWDGHAGSVETSRIIAIRPDLVKGTGKSYKAKFPQYRVVPNPEDYFPSGVMGDPESASLTKGKKWNDLVLKEFRELIDGFLQD